MDQKADMRSLTLTEMQAEFVHHFTATLDVIGNASASAVLAGYSERSAKETGYQLLHKPHVKKAIDEANRQSISGQIATKAVALLHRVIDDEKTPIKVRVDAAKTILDRAGIVSQSAIKEAEEDAKLQKPLHIMTRTELQEVINKSSAVLDAAAQRERDAEQREELADVECAAA